MKPQANPFSTRPVHQAPSAQRWRWLAPMYLIALLGLSAACSLSNQLADGAGRASGDAQRGAYVASIYGCINCHTVHAADGMTPAPDALLAGGRPFSGPWGTVYSANVTAVVPTLDDAQLEQAIRGQSTYLYIMPTAAFNTMAQQDMRDLIAYLRTLKPIGEPVAPITLDPTFKPPPPTKPAPIPAAAPLGPTVDRGRYLVTQAACGDCHTPLTPQGEPDTSRLLAGGIQFPGPNGTTYVTPNLTPDPATGAMATWTDAQIARAIRTGIAADGHQLNPTMPYAGAYHVFTDEDIAAVIAYLRSLPPIHHPLPSNPAWKRAP